MKRSIRRCAAGVLMVLAWALPAARAQTIIDPSRPIRIVLGVGPGSSLELVNRTLAEQLRQQMGNPVTVEFRPGADSILAVTAVTNAAPDGLTMVPISAGSAIINHMTYSQLPYKPSDIKPLVGLYRIGTTLAVAADNRFPGLRDLVEAARKSPGTVSMGAYAPIYQFGVQMFAGLAGVKFNHVNYKGVGPMSTDIVGGSLDAGFADASGVAPLVQAGKLRALAVSTRERLAMLPGVPTFRELGYTDYDPQVWVGMAIHGRTPESVAQRLEAELNRAMQSPAWKALLERQGNLESWSLGSREFPAFLATQAEYFTKMSHLFEKKN